MDAIRQSLYGLNLAPLLFGTLAFAGFFALMMFKRTRRMHPQRLWILPVCGWIITVTELVNMPPQTGTQVVGFLVLAITGLGIGVVLCLSDSLTCDSEAGAFLHRSSVLSCASAALIVAIMIGYSLYNLWLGFVFLAGFVSGQSACLWRWAEHLRNPSEFSAHTGM